MSKRTKQFLALKPQWQLFVAAYLEEFDAAAAYVAAGYGAKGAHANGSRLLKQPEVAAAIQAETNVLLGELKITPGKILRDLEAARLAAMGAGRYSAAIMAIERMARYVNAFPNQYSSGNGDVPIPGFNEHNPDAPVPIDDVSRRILFLLTGAVASAEAKPPPAEPAIKPTLQ